MRTWNFFTCCLFSVYSLSFICLCTSQNLFEADDLNFRDIVEGDYDACLVEFYAPWCGHCKRLEPELENMSKLLKGTKTAIVKVDAESSPKLKSKYKIKGFPSIKLFKGGEMVGDYEGPRMGAQMANFMLRTTSSLITHLEAGGLKRFEQLGGLANQSAFVVLGQMATGDAVHAVVEASAKNHSNSLWFGHLPDETGRVRASRYKATEQETIVVALDPSHGLQGMIKAPFTAEDFETFVETHTWTPILPLSQATFPDAVRSPRPLALVLVQELTQPEITAKIISSLVPIAQTYRSKYLMAKVDVDTLAPWLEKEFGLNVYKSSYKIYPGFLVYNPPDDPNFYHDYAWRTRGNTFAKAVQVFLKDIEDGQILPQSLLSESFSAKAQKLFQKHKWVVLFLVVPLFGFLLACANVAVGDRPTHLPDKKTE